MKDTELIEELIKNLSVSILDTHDENQKKNIELLENYPTKLVAQCVAQAIFSAEPTGNESSPEKPPAIISVLILLGSSKKYTKDLAKAVREDAIRRSRSGNEDREHWQSFQTFIAPHLLPILLHQVTSCSPHDPNIQVASDSIDTIVACSELLGPTFAEPVLRDVQVALKNTIDQEPTNKSTTSTVTIRCVSLILKLLPLHESITELAQACGATKLILKTLEDESDPLQQMSILDLLEQLLVQTSNHSLPASCQHWIFSDSVLLPLLKMAGVDPSQDQQESSKTTPSEPDPILGGPSLRVLAAMCGHVEVLRDDSDPERRGKLLDYFHRAIHQFQSSELDRLATVDAISSFASASNDCLELILSDGDVMRLWMNLAVAQPKIKAVILQSISRVLEVAQMKDDATGDVDMQSTGAPTTKNCLRLYAALGQKNDSDSTDIVLALAGNPMPELRIAAYVLFSNVAKLKTGSQILLAHSKFYEFLIRRDGESTKEGKEAKYTVVKAIYDSEVKGLLADNIVRAIEKYVKEGPFYVKTIPWDVVTE